MENQIAPGGSRGYIDSADENIVAITIIEEGRAVENVEAIAATPGIDALFIGTSDFMAAGTRQYLEPLGRAPVVPKPKTIY